MARWREPRVMAAIYFYTVGKTGNLRGLVNSLTKDVLLATVWWVRVRG